MALLVSAHAGIEHKPDVAQQIQAVTAMVEAPQEEAEEDVDGCADQNAADALRETLAKHPGLVGKLRNFITEQPGVDSIEIRQAKLCLERGFGVTLRSQAHDQTGGLRPVTSNARVVCIQQIVEDSTV